MSQKMLLESLFLQGKINRREFMHQLAAIGVISTLGSTILPMSAKASTPNKGGHLRLGLSGGSTASSLDPATIESVMTESINWQLRNCLVEVDHTGKLIPELAESWEASPDATEWVFNLRKGVEFHNGKTLEAEDVMSSINYHRGKDSKSRAKSIVTAIKSIKSDGKSKVIFTLNEGNADFPYIMSDFHLTIQPAGTTDYNIGIGTGGYILKSYEPGVRCLVERNPNYWKSGRAHFDIVETLSISDTNARTNALQTGRIDAMDRCDAKTVHLLAKSRGVKILKYNGTRHFTFPMLTDTAPFDNVDVRLALKYAIDREHMVKTILRGYGSVGNDHPIARSNQFFASELPQRTHDPDKAKYHWKKSGVGNQTIELHLADAAFNGAVDAGMLYSEHAKKAGIDIKVIRVPNDGYWKDVWKKVPFCGCYWTSRPTEDWMFSMAYAAEAKQNDTRWKNSRFNELLLAARSELDKAKRRSMYVEMQTLVRDDGGTVVPMFADYVEGISSKLSHGELAGNMELDGLRCAERWWFS